MMRKIWPALLLASSLGGGAAYYNGVDVPVVKQAGEWMSGATSAAPAEEVLLHTEAGRLKIGAYHVEDLDVAKLNRAPVGDVLVAVAGRFDVLALQGIRSESQEVLPRLVERLNAAGGRYEYVIGPRVGRGWEQWQAAFVYDAARVEVDRIATYTVDDPDDLLEREPLVAAFRARVVAEEEAFTFTLVNVQVKAEEAEKELRALGEVYRAVKGDGRGEDDVMLVGTMWREQGRLGELEGTAGMRVVPADLLPSEATESVVDHFVFQELATVEFTGGGGFVDVMGEFGLSEGEVAAISRHVPIWAEFSVYEGGRPERFVGREMRAESR